MKQIKLFLKIILSIIAITLIIVIVAYGTNYKNEKELRINTLENAVYMNMKNDVSYVFRFEMTLYEHQSTLCPNMPLRDLFYVSRLLESELEQCKTLREYSMFVDLIRKNIVMSNKIDKNVIFV